MDEPKVYRMTIVNPVFCHEGRADDISRALLEILLKNECRLTASLGEKEISLANANDLFERLYSYEKEQGVAAVVRAFMAGVTIQAGKKGKRTLTVTTTLEAPESSENKEKYVEMIEEWVSQDRLAFVERFFRRPTLAQDPADRFLDNPLESCLKYVLGQAFTYRVTIACLRPLDIEEGLREELAQAMHGGG